MKKVLTLSLILSATTAFAQTPPQPAHTDKWAPWIGCWQIAEESVEDAERLLEAFGAAAGRSTTAPGARVCVTPSPAGGATMTTYIKDKAVVVETIIADGQRRPLADPSCRGSQQAEWSQLAPRIYARTDVSCGDQPQRRISGFSAIVAGPLWLDIQVIESEGRKSMRVRRYRRAANQDGAPGSLPTLGTMPLVSKLSLADIKEASAKVTPEALQAAVIELGGRGYDLNAKRLVELDEAGVPDSVIDLMVAMSFPKKFVVERSVPAFGPGGFGGYSGMWGPYEMWPYYAHPAYYSSYYSPFGYSYWGYNDPYYYGTPGVVVINPGGPGGAPDPSGNGRVVDGQGYTRIRPNVPERTNSGGRSGWGTSGADPGSGSNGGGSSGGTVSTGGYSSGGGGGERVAVPRPPGGN